MNRRTFLTQTASFAVVGASSPLIFASESSASMPARFKTEFAAAVVKNPYLTPLKGVTGDLVCESLALEGKLPRELRGRFYRNGPAIFERGNERYQHWFDGDGMVQQFSFDGSRVSHRGRIVRTEKYVAEQAAGEFLVPAFGTGLRPKRRITGPDSMNTANTNAIEHAGRVLAMWEGGSAHELDPKTLDTKGAVTWQSGWEQMPFSAHPKLDPQGTLWNFGSVRDRFFVYRVDASGKLANTQTARVAIDRNTHGGMVHDMAITERFFVVPIPPVTIQFELLAQGKFGADVMKLHKGAPLKIWVAPKDDVSKGRIFDLPHDMVFHVGNAFERRGASGTEIEMTYVGSRDDNFLGGGAVSMMRGQHSKSGESAMRTVTLNLTTGSARLETFDNSFEEFPRIDPRFIGSRSEFVVSPTSWRNREEVDVGFHAIQVRQLASGNTTRFNYGEDFIVEEHIVVPRPGSSKELDGWIIGTAFNAKRQQSCVSVFAATRIADGPVARAWLPYWIPLGFHGNFISA